ncbi:MAG: CRISPR-associated endoribonuclease Cas6 [Thermovenabulum sp.]|uniref:CRISPR-associated endoribonuclease Cas6 n=1 Tax=Thermovenabulum sp. TaxID=3100335 RepID=UPI003C7CFFAB
MAKLFITLKADKISRNYNMQAVAFIKDVIKSIDPIEYEKLYHYNDNGVVRANKKPKPFCIGVKPYNYLKTKEEMEKQKQNKEKLYEAEGDMLKLKEGIFTIIVSAADKELLQKMAEELKKSREAYKVAFGWNIAFDPVIKQEPYIKSGRIKIRTVTPIVVTDREGHLIDIEKEANKFNESLNYIMNQVFLAVFGRPLKKPINLMPVKDKDTKKYVYSIVKNTIKVDNFEGIIKGYCGRFYIAGDPEDINHIINLGIGFRRSQGYGMITLAPSEMVKIKLKKGKARFSDKGKNTNKQGNQKANKQQKAKR